MDYRFHHLHLICRDLEQMIEFFTAALGAQLVARRKLGNADGAMLDLTGVPVWLRGLRPGEEIDAEPKGKRFGYDHIGVAVDNLYDAYLELVAKGITFTMPPANQEAKVAFFEGPDHLQVELFQP
jgi:catechol 2,3-dioxygenase-like lactoylglutathione lyase family enzyme